MMYLTYTVLLAIIKLWLLVKSFHKFRLLKGVAMLPFQNAVDELHRTIGPTLIAFACASQDSRIAQSWISGDRRPTHEDERRIYFMVSILRTVASEEGQDVARAWFIGANCEDMTRSPVEMIRDGRLVEAEVSATQLITDSHT